MLHYSKTQDESALLAMAQGGDGNALVELLNQYAAQAYRVAFRITHNHQDAEDVLQESHLNAYRRLSQFRGESRFSAWLLTQGGASRERPGRRRQDADAAL
jgi:RNA polymerase sigma-70 factor (ECF subfamily)